VIVEQNVTAEAGVKTLDNSPNLFTIADLSRVWIVCDVYENDLANVRLGEYADIHLNAYPGRSCRGAEQHRPDPRPEHPHRQGPARSGKSRLMRLGMFVTATSMASRRRRARWFRPPRCCTCTTATGSTCRPAATRSGAWR